MQLVDLGHICMMKKCQFWSGSPQLGPFEFAKTPANEEISRSELRACWNTLSCSRMKVVQLHSLRNRLSSFQSSRLILVSPAWFPSAPTNLIRWENVCLRPMRNTCERRRCPRICSHLATRITGDSAMVSTGSSMSLVHIRA